uniref:Uncharacterized protein n=1 Tax=Clytia hemisphaerica TaxID=252671 RepID=A0A7M5X3B7_9CNID
MIEDHSRIGLLLHNREETYEHILQVPVKMGTFVFSETVMLLPAGCMQSQTTELFQGSNTEEATKHAKSWLAKRKGIRCSKSGGYINEYNFRFYIKSESTFKDRMIQVF